MTIFVFYSPPSISGDQKKNHRERGRLHTKLRNVTGQMADCLSYKIVSMDSMSAAIKVTEKEGTYLQYYIIGTSKTVGPKFLH